MALEEGEAFGRPKAHVTDAIWEAYTGRSTFHYNSIKKLTSYLMTRQKSHHKNDGHRRVTWPRTNICLIIARWTISSLLLDNRNKDCPLNPI